MNNFVSFYFQNANDMVMKRPFNDLKDGQVCRFIDCFSKFPFSSPLAKLLPTFSRARVVKKLIRRRRKDWKKKQVEAAANGSSSEREQYRTGVVVDGSNIGWKQQRMVEAAIDEAL
jgi:hypothetical protein